MNVKSAKGAGILCHSARSNLAHDIVLPFATLRGSWYDMIYHYIRGRGETSAAASPQAGVGVSESECSALALSDRAAADRAAGGGEGGLDLRLCVAL